MMVDSTVKVFKFVCNVMFKYDDYTDTFGAKNKGFADRHLVKCYKHGDIININYTQV